MTSWETYLHEHQQQYLEELLEFLRIPSISSLPEHKDDAIVSGHFLQDPVEAAHMRLLEGALSVPHAVHLHFAGSDKKGPLDFSLPDFLSHSPNGDAVHPTV